MTTNMTSCEKLKVLELYSGIGGMHWALKESGKPYEVVMAVDINTSANRIYGHNFPDVNLHSFGIEKLTLKKVSSLSCNTILMSPPCQPFTRVGKKADCDDVRTKSFLHVLQLVRELDQKPKYILVENVKGFEISRTRQLLVEMLQDCHYSFQEFLLNPLQFDIPNSRLRYYLTARLAQWPAIFHPQEQVLHFLPRVFNDSSHKNRKDDDSEMENQDCSCQSDISGDSSTHPEKPSNLNCGTSSIINVDKRDSSSVENLTSKDTSNCDNSSSCASKHSRQDDDQNATPTLVKRLKSTDSGDHVENFRTASKEITLSRTKEVTDLVNAGRNMRYCEEDDDLITGDCHQLSDYMEQDDHHDFTEYLLTDKNLTLFVIMDVVLPVLRKSTCFTKRYGHYIEGAGSIVQMSLSAEETKAASDLKCLTVNLKNNHQWGEQELSLLRKLKLRYFTPREVANLLCFPSEFSFPSGFSNVQKYRVLGNSLNVHVVSELIKFMVVS